MTPSSDFKTPIVGPHGVKVVCLVSHPSGGSSELACAMRINLVIQIILAC